MGKGREDLAQDTKMDTCNLSLGLFVLSVMRAIKPQGLAAPSTVQPGLSFRNYGGGLTVHGFSTTRKMKLALLLGNIFCKKLGMQIVRTHRNVKIKLYLCLINQTL
jgi:hypothetical protein